MCPDPLSGVPLAFKGGGAWDSLGHGCLESGTCGFVPWFLGLTLRWQVAVYGSFCEFTEWHEKSHGSCLLVGSLSEDSDLPHAGNPKETGATTVLLTPASQVDLDYSSFFFFLMFLEHGYGFSHCYGITQPWFLAHRLHSDELMCGGPHSKCSSSMQNFHSWHCFSTHLELHAHLELSSTVTGPEVEEQRYKSQLPCLWSLLWKSDIDKWNNSTLRRNMVVFFF